MCRFVAYLGSPIIIDELLLKPENSLVNQSYDAEEMSQTLNGDGFGLGWYVKEIREAPGLFKSITPAWSNQNLLYNASLIRTNCLFAHIRAATEGHIAELNCHPFIYDKFLMMHNGGIPKFDRIKRRLRSHLDEEFYLWVKGQTDSEHIFALLMQHVKEIKQSINRPLETSEVADAFKRTFDVIEDMRRDAGIENTDKPAAYNMMITDGERIYGTRYSSDPQRGSPTLYYSTGARYTCDGGVCRMVTDNGNHEKAALIVSEKLTLDPTDWKPIPVNHFIAVERDLSVETGLLN